MCKSFVRAEKARTKQVWRDRAAGGGGGRAIYTSAHQCLETGLKHSDLLNAC